MEQRHLEIFATILSTNQISRVIAHPEDQRDRVGPLAKVLRKAALIPENAGCPKRPTVSIGDQNGAGIDRFRFSAAQARISRTIRIDNRDPIALRIDFPIVNRHGPRAPGCGPARRSPLAGSPARARIFDARARQRRGGSHLRFADFGDVRPAEQLPMTHVMQVIRTMAEDAAIKAA